MEATVNPPGLPFLPIFRRASTEEGGPLKRRESKVLPHSPACTQCHAELQPSVRWHPIIPVPLCLGCYVSATQTIHALYRRHQQQAWLDRQNETRGQGAGRSESIATAASATTASVCSAGSGSTISNESEDNHSTISSSSTTSSGSRQVAPITVCIWCLRLVQDAEAASGVLRCGEKGGPSSTGPKHPSHVVFCRACLSSYFNAPTVEHWSMQSKEGTWTCLICDKAPLLELAWEEGWGLPQYPQDLRLSAEIQDVLAKAFAVPHPRRREITMMSVSPPTEGNGSGTTRDVSRKRSRPATTTATTDSPSLPPFLVPLTAQQQQQPPPQQHQPNHHHHHHSHPHPHQQQQQQQQQQLQPQQQQQQEKERPQAASPLDWQSLLAGCEGDATLVVLVEQTQQALSLLTRLWREAAVQVAAREDMLDMGLGLTREMMLMQQGRMAEGEGLTRRSTIDYMTAGTGGGGAGDDDARSSISGSSGESSSSKDCGGAGCGAREGPTATAGMNMAEKEAQQAVRKSLLELRVLLRQMRLMSDQRQQGSAVEAVKRFQQQHEQQQQQPTEGGEALSSSSSSDSFGLEYEMERMEQLQAWLLSSQGVLRGLHSQVLEVLTRAQSQPSSPSSSSQVSAGAGASLSEAFSAGKEGKIVRMGMEGRAGEGKKMSEKHAGQEEEDGGGLEEDADFKRRLRASGESLKELEKDLSLRLEDVGYAVSILCQMKGKVEAREKKQQGETQQQKQDGVVVGKEQGQEKKTKVNDMHAID